MSAIAITGHRPKDLFGYDLSHAGYVRIGNLLQDILISESCEDMYDGVALGADWLAVIVAEKLRREGHDIRIHAAVPCLNHPSAWPAKSRKEYESILAMCDDVTIVTKAPYSAKLMQVRNEYMVDRADTVVAIYERGKSGGTKNCVDYALRVGKRVICIPPFKGDPYEIA